jgi:glycosyltransferase involved in cell wall biosynthesis
VNPNVAGLLPGSGVDLEKFKPQNLVRKDQKIKFLMVARMLWEKGVGEYVQASSHLKIDHPNVEFSLLGFLDVKNPHAISREQMDIWVSSTAINYLGVSDDVASVMSEYDVIVLPSKYREGTPRSLLEAAALGKPIVTTNTSGCRDVVDDGVSGYLCLPGDAQDLSLALGKMLALTPDERQAMGQKGRLKIERFYDERLVINQYLKALIQLKRI